ncbi:hypothetical protein BHE74_00047906 [Ensete ventricosum]|nr:hypothetical protein BHE74_00047906 [Ensete ventricosum]
MFLLHFCSEGNKEKGQPAMASPYAGQATLALAASSRPLAGGHCRGLTVGGRPCIGAGRGWPPLLLAGFAAKT